MRPEGTRLSMERGSSCSARCWWARSSIASWCLEDEDGKMSVTSSR
jgi:hypothetical protein